MNSRSRLLLSLAIPVLLIAVVVGTFLWRQSASTSATSTQAAQKGCPKASTSTSNAGTHLQALTLALDWTPNTNHTGIYAALAQGCYRSEGIDLKLLPYSSSVSPDVLVSNGKADVGISSTEGIVADAAVGQPVVSIAAIIEHNTSALVTLANSGIARPAQLDGKVYGAFGAPYENAVVGEVIKKDGGKGVFKSVTLDIDPVQALETHRIDFAWVFEGWEVIQAQRDGYKLNVFPIVNYGIPDYYTPNFIASPNEIQQKSDLLHKFIAATAWGYDYARLHPREAAQMLLNGAPKGTFPDPGLVMASQQYLSPRYVDAGRKWGLQDAAAWLGYPQFILKANGVDNASGKPIQSLNLNALYTNQFLE